MKKLLSHLEGKKTHLVVLAILGFNALWIAGVIDPDPKHVEGINYLLAATGLTTLRLGVKNEQRKK